MKFEMCTSDASNRVSERERATCWHGATPTELQQMSVTECGFVLLLVEMCVRLLLRFVAVHMFCAFVAT